jgi:hypothetical protein
MGKSHAPSSGVTPCLPGNRVWAARVAADGSQVSFTVMASSPASVLDILICGELGLCPQPSPDFVEDKPLAETRQISRDETS